MKHKSTHITWLIICILAAGAGFLVGVIHGEESERKRITKGFVKVFQEQFGTGSMGTGSQTNNTGGNNK